MKTTLKSRVIRAEIVLDVGERSLQDRDIYGANDAELERAAYVFTQGVLTVLEMLYEKGSVHVDWADQWGRPTAPAVPRRAGLN